MAPLPVFVLGGAAIGTLTGLFGVGGSSVATPLLSLLGVPPLLAVASPLPATIPTAIVAAIPYLREHEAKPRAAAWTLFGGVPAAIVGAFLSHAVGGPTLLIVSGTVLIAVGQRVLRPIDPTCEAAGSNDAGTDRSSSRPRRALGYSPGCWPMGVDSSWCRCTCCYSA